MRITAITSAPLVPRLRDVLNKRIGHDPATLCSGDRLHFGAALLGYPKGAVVAVYGLCVHADASGQPYAVRAYVRPNEAGEHAVAFADRDAQRYPTEGQREQWFGSYLLFLVEVDVTDCGHLLRLERVPERVAAVITPTQEIRLAA